MTKAELESLLRRAGAVARDSDFFLLGSQAIRGSCRRLPRGLPHTFEADLYPQHRPEAWKLLFDELGPQSAFFKRRSFHLDCVDPGLATLPDGWTERLVPFRTPRTGGVTAWCLELHDLFVSKLAAGRKKDLKYLAVLLRHGLVRVEILENRIEDTPVTPSGKQDMLRRLKRLVGQRLPPAR